MMISGNPSEIFSRISPEIVPKIIHQVDYCGSLSMTERFLRLVKMLKKCSRNNFSKSLLQCFSRISSKSFLHFSKGILLDFRDFWLCSCSDSSRNFLQRFQNEFLQRSGQFECQQNVVHIRSRKLLNENFFDLAAGTRASSMGALQNGSILVLNVLLVLKFLFIFV